VRIEPEPPMHRSITSPSAADAATAFGRVERSSRSPPGFTWPGGGRYTWKAEAYAPLPCFARSRLSTAIGWFDSCSATALADDTAIEAASAPGSTVRVGGWLPSPSGCNAFTLSTIVTGRCGDVGDSVCA